MCCTRKKGREHKPNLPCKQYFTEGLPPVVEMSWNCVTTDDMLSQCLHPYHTQMKEACINSLTNCEQPKARCQYAGLPELYFCAGMFAIRQCIGFVGLLYTLQQSGGHVTKGQIAIVEALYHGIDKQKAWRATEHEKASCKCHSNAKPIEQVRDAASEQINPTYVSAGFGGTRGEHSSGDGEVVAQSARKASIRKEIQCSNCLHTSWSLTCLVFEA